MNQHRHGPTRRAVRALFDGESLRMTGAELYAQLDRCPECAAWHECLAQQEAALSGRGSVPLQLELERIAAVVFARRAASSKRRQLAIWLAPAAAVMASILAVILLADWPTRPNQQTNSPDMVARGPALVCRAEISQTHEVGVRVFRVSRAPRSWTPGQPVERSAVVSFTYTNLRSDLRYLALFGVQERGYVRRYYPSDDNDGSMPILAGVVDEPLGDGFDLSLRHEAGPLRVIGLFSRQPLDISKVEAAILVARGRAADLDSLEAVMDTDGVLEHSFVLDIEE